MLHDCCTQADSHNSRSNPTMDSIIACLQRTPYLAYLIIYIIPLALSTTSESPAVSSLAAIQAIGAAIPGWPPAPPYPKYAACNWRWRNAPNPHRNCPTCNLCGPEEQNHRPDNQEIFNNCTMDDGSVERTSFPILAPSHGTFPAIILQLTSPSTNIRHLRTSLLLRANTRRSILLLQGTR